MISPQSNVAILGATGSIGRNTLEVIAASNGAFRAVALTAHSNVELILQQAHAYKPRWVVVTDPVIAHGISSEQLPSETELLVGPEAVEQVVSSDEVDTVVSAIVGIAGLRGTLAALDAKKRVALANKESLVVAGSQVTELAARRRAPIIPVDSEHSAIFQVLESGRRDELRRIILTASGGPFRSFSAEQMANVTVDQALAHPTWDMGPKISIDSATMMNKALEIIEARWLFDLAPDQLEEQVSVVVHPQSIVHSMVEFIDGSVLAQLGPPDMRLPIQYALTYPQRSESPGDKLDLTKSVQLDFEPPDTDRFPALRLGMEVARVGGTAGAVLNAANESAVASLLDGRLSFAHIVPACQAVLDNHNFDSNPTLDEIMRLDAWAREEISRWICV